MRWTILRFSSRISSALFAEVSRLLTGTVEFPARIFYVRRNLLDVLTWDRHGPIVASKERLPIGGGDTTMDTLPTSELKSLLTHPLARYIQIHIGMSLL